MMEKTMGEKLKKWFKKLRNAGKKLKRGWIFWGFGEEKNWGGGQQNEKET